MHVRLSLGHPLPCLRLSALEGLPSRRSLRRLAYTTARSLALPVFASRLLPLPPPAASPDAICIWAVGTRRRHPRRKPRPPSSRQEPKVPQRRREEEPRGLQRA